MWPRPGRVFAAARSHTFAALADAIDTAFARWDRAHLCAFKLADGTRVCGPIAWDDPPAGSVLASATRLSRLTVGEQLLYTFDMGDDWTHLCTVAQERIDPLEALGDHSRLAVGVLGLGRGRRTADDDGETLLPPDPELADLPPLRPFWGPRPP